MICKIPTCKQEFPDAGDGFDGFCPECADWLEVHKYWDEGEDETLLAELTIGRLGPIEVTGFFPNTFPADENTYELSIGGRTLRKQEWMTDNSSGDEYLEPDEKPSEWRVIPTDQLWHGIEFTDEFHELIGRHTEAVNDAFQEIWSERIRPLIDEAVKDAVTRAKEKLNG